MKILSILLLVSLMFESNAGLLFITVGDEDDVDCDFHTIQAAINSDASSVVRIASNKIYFENIGVFNKSKELVGGYANCSQAELNITDLSQANIFANDNNPVVHISNTAGQSNQVLLRNILTVNGTVGVFVNSQNVGSDSLVTLDNILAYNHSVKGVSILELNGAQAEVIINDSLIHYNPEGGVMCQGSGATLKVTGETVITFNETDSYGAGIRAHNGCHLEVYSPTEISNNTAGLSGGGIYVSSATAGIYGVSSGCENGICFGQWDSPVSIINNQTDEAGEFGSGGGLAVNGENSEVMVFNTLFENNQANHRGGAIYVGSGVLTAFGFEDPEQGCWSPGSCLQFKANKADEGGAIAASGDGNVRIFYAHFNKNRANAGVVTTSSGGATIELSHSVVSNNGSDGAGEFIDLYLFYQRHNAVFPSSNLLLEYVTVADNNFNQTLFNNANGQLDVLSSIVLHDFDIYLASGNSPSVDFECVIASESASFPAGGTVTVVDENIEPLFVNPAAGNYHLKLDSPAIDYCYDVSGNGVTDIDYDLRGIDNPDVADLFGLYDIGADEFNIDNDIIFKHGFEQD